MLVEEQPSAECSDIVDLERELTRGQGKDMNGTLKGGTRIPDVDERWLWVVGFQPKADGKDLSGGAVTVA